MAHGFERLVDLDLVRVNREGWPFIAVFAVAALLLFILWVPLGWLGVLATAWCVFFFRDPERVTPVRPGLLVAPADGIVMQVVEAPPPPELDMGTDPTARVSIFLNVFDVHVNRAPCDGTVERRVHRPGRFLNAAVDRASQENERMALRIRLDGVGTAAPRQVAVVQIAGLVARRIRCWVKEGDRLAAGARFGMIRFGSRTDLYLPSGVEPLVAEGQRMVAGETVVADLHSQEPARRGARR